ncbi:MAG: hypothetical protein KGL95_14600, partial [Patescibacteria group bacterium]|nr:hypothetical protein [Patescibacteria group bacterium]
NALVVNLTYIKVYIVEPVTDPSASLGPYFPPCAASDWRPGNAQIHAPFLAPDGRFGSFCEWTSNKIWVVNIPSGSLYSFSEGERTRWRHGFNVNQGARYAVSLPYYYNRSDLNLYNYRSDGGAYEYITTITLRKRSKKCKCHKEVTGYFAHYIVWLDDFSFFVGTMQQTDLTCMPCNGPTAGVSVWYVDLHDLCDIKTKEIISNNTMLQDSGFAVATAISDLALGYLPGSEDDSLYLWVGQEDSVELPNGTNNDGNRGRITLWKLNRECPQAKLTTANRVLNLVPGNGLPAQWNVSHTLNWTPDYNYLYAFNYYNSLIIKFNVQTLQAVTMFEGPAGSMLHGCAMQGVRKG